MKTVGCRWLSSASLGVFVASLLWLPPSGSLAQERHKVAWSARPENTKYTFQHVLEVGDVPGHAIRMIEIRRTFPDNAMTFEGLKVVEDVSRGTTDLIAGNGFGSGYTTAKLENGDLMFSQWQNSVQTVVNQDGSRKTVFVGTYITTGGTGKARGVKGFGRFSGLSELNAAGMATRNEYSGEGEYWIEK